MKPTPHWGQIFAAVVGVRSSFGLVDGFESKMVDMPRWEEGKASQVGSLHDKMIKSVLREFVNHLPFRDLVMGPAAVGSRRFSKTSSLGL